METCYGPFCFVPLDVNSYRIFGFSEFIMALALMVLVWTTIGARYQFRIRTAPLPLHKITYASVLFIGILVLLTDLWHARKWYVLKGNIIPSDVWSALLGGWFFLIFMLWVWFAFIRPSIFSRWNARQYTVAVFQTLLKGSPSELPEIADELIRSTNALIKISWGIEERNQNKSKDKNWFNFLSRSAKAKDYAYDVLAMIADRRFCRYIVQHCPTTALALMESAAVYDKYDLPLEIFAKNITAEALNYKDSFIYQEKGSLFSGVIGFHKPITSNIYGNSALVEAFSSLNIDYQEKDAWDSEQWEGYLRLLTLSFEDYVVTHKNSFVDNVPDFFHDFVTSFPLFAFSLQAINPDIDTWHEHDHYKKLRAITWFLNDLLTILDKHYYKTDINLRWKEHSLPKDIYDHIAVIMFDLIHMASGIKKNQEFVWQVQYGMVWSRFFRRFREEGRATDIVLFKLRRLIHNGIYQTTRMLGFKAAHILGMTLNVMGVTLDPSLENYPDRPLHIAILKWTKRHFRSLMKEYPKIAKACLVDGIAIENDGKQIAKIYISHWKEKPDKDVLILDDDETEA